MTTKALSEAIPRAEAWPAEAQDELAAIVGEMEVGFGGGYHARPEVLAGVERGIREADAGLFATEAEIEATFARYRGK